MFLRNSILELEPTWLDSHFLPDFLLTNQNSPTPPFNSLTKIQYKICAPLQKE